MAESIELQIESDARGAVKSIGNLETKLSSLGKTLSSINTSNLHSFSSGLKELSVSMGSLSKIDTRTFTKVAKNIKKFEEIDSGKISQLSSTLAPLTQGLSAFSSTSFDNKSLTNFVNSFTRLANSNISGLSNVNFTDLGNRINGLASALSNASNVEKNTIQVVNAVSNLAKAGDKAQATATSLPLLGSNLRSLISSLSTASIVSDNTIQFASALGVLASAGNRTAQTASNLGLLATELKKFMQVMATAPTVSANIIQMTNALANLANTGSKAGSASKNLISGFTGISKHTRSASKGFGGLSSAIGRFYAKWFIVIRAIRKLGDFVNLSSQLTEVQNVVDTTFGNMTNKVDDFVKTSIQDFGMSELTAKQIASRFQALGTAVNISSQQIAQGTKLTNEMFANQKDTLYESTESLADMSLNLTKLSADMASFYDVDQTDVAKSLQSIFTGTIAPMRQYGIDLTQATLKEFALKNGLDADIKSMTQAEKVMLRYQYVMANTTAAQGDFAKTADTWANSVRTLKQEFEAWGSIVGKVIINAFKPFVIALKKAMVYVIQFTQTVADALGAIFGWTIEVSGGGIADGMEDIADSTDGIGTSADKANSSAKKLKNTLLSIDEIHALNDNTDSSSGSGSGSGTGAGGGSGVNTSLKQVDGLVEKYQSSIKDLYHLGSYIGDAITDSLNSIDWDKVYQGAKNFGTGLADFLNGLISPELFGAVGKTIASALNTAIYSALSFGETFDWSNLGLSIATSINEFFDTFDFVALAETLNTWVDGLEEAIGTAIKNIDYEEILKDLYDFFSNLEFDTVAVVIGTLTVKRIGKVAIKKALKELIGRKLTTALARLGIGTVSIPELAIGFASILPRFQGTASFDIIGGWIISGIEDAMDKLLPDAVNDFVGKFVAGFAIGGVATGGNPLGAAIGGLLASFPIDINWFGEGGVFSFDWANEWFEKAKDSFKTAFDGNRLDLIDMGGWILEGILDGFVGAFVFIFEPIKRFFDEIVNGVKEIFGIASPAKEMKPIGGYILLGIVEGFSDKVSEFNTAISNWFNGSVKPWFTKEKWAELGSNAKTSLSNKWNEFTSWWQGTGVPNWWNNNVSPWFTKEKWQNLGANAKEGIQTKWNEFTEWWNNTSFAPWWSGVKEKFSKSSWSFSGIKEGLSSAWDSAVEAIKGTWNTFAAWLNKKLTLNIDTSTTIGKAVKTALGTSTITLGKIPTFRAGGFPDGENGLFYANSNELVGKFSNGKTAVANNDQITDGIRQAVVEGMMEVFMATNSNSSPSESSAPIIENIVKVDSETLYRITQQGKAVHDQRFNVITEIG